MSTGAIARYLANVSVCPNCGAPRADPKKLKCPECGWIYKLKKMAIRKRETAVVQRYPIERKPRKSRKSRVRHPDEVYEKHAERASESGKIIRIRGFAVPAADIEKRLVEHPSVRAACAVLRFVKANKAPAIVAFVELEDNVTVWKGISQDLREWCRGGMPAWKMPDRVLPISRVMDRKAMAREPLRRLRSYIPAPEIRDPLNEFRFEGVVREVWTTGQKTSFVVAQRAEGGHSGISLRLYGALDLRHRLKHGALVAVAGKFGAHFSLRAIDVETRERRTKIRLSNTKAVLEVL